VSERDRVHACALARKRERGGKKEREREREREMFTASGHELTFTTIISQDDHLHII